MSNFRLYCGIGCSLFALLFHQIHAEEKASAHTDSLKINFLLGDLTTLHPHLGTDLRGRALGKALFEGLTRNNEEGEVEMAAAEEVDISDNVYTFTLRPHLWSNGEPVTAYHFEAAWKLALSPKGICRRADLFYIIKNAKEVREGAIPMDQLGVKALNKHTLHVELTHPAPYFLNLISASLFSPLFDEAKEPQIFNGPFVLDTWKRDVTLKLARNPNYWDGDNVHLQEIVFSMIKDASTALTLFEQGELDHIGDPFSGLPLDAVASNTYSDRLKSMEVARTFWICLNTEKPPMNSTKIRKALSHVIDRKNLTTHLLIGQSPHKSPVPKNLSLLTENEMYEDADLEGGIKLFEEGLKELGLTRETCPPLTLTYSHLPGQKNLAEALQQVWQTAFGVPVKLEGCEWNVLFSRFREGQFHLGCCLNITWYSDPHYYLEIFKDKNHFSNASRWENATYKKLLDLSNTNDEKQRAKHLKKAEKLLLEEMPVIPIFVQTYKYMMHDKLDGLSFNTSGIVDFKTACFK